MVAEIYLTGIDGMLIWQWKYLGYWGVQMRKSCWSDAGGGGKDMKDAVNRVAIKDISEKVNAPEWI